MCMVGLVTPAATPRTTAPIVRPMELALLDRLRPCPGRISDPDTGGADCRCGGNWSTWAISSLEIWLRPRSVHLGSSSVESPAVGEPPRGVGSSDPGTGLKRCPSNACCSNSRRTAGTTTSALAFSAHLTAITSAHLAGSGASAHSSLGEGVEVELGVSFPGDLPHPPGDREPRGETGMGNRPSSSVSSSVQTRGGGQGSAWGFLKARDPPHPREGGGEVVRRWNAWGFDDDPATFSDSSVSQSSNASMSSHPNELF